MIARDIMTPNPIAAEVTTPIHEIIVQLYESDVHHLPIVERGELVGIVSDRDLKGLTGLIPEGPEARESLARRLEEPIATLMQGGVIFVDVEEEIDDIVDLMIDQRIGAVPVVNTDQGRQLVGIISTIDLLKEASFS